MNILIYLIFSVLFAPGVFASIFTVVDVGLECDFSDGCERFEKNINEFVDQEYTRESFREKIRVIPLDESIDGFSYRLNIRANKTAELVIRIRPRVKIQKIVFKSNYNIDFAQLEKFFLYKEGDYYHSWKMPDAYKEIRKYFNERGFEVRNIQVMREERGGDIDLTFGIDIVHVKIINKIDIVCENNGLKEELYKRFLKLRGSVWDKLKIKVEIGGISKELYERGYFQSKVSDITSSIQEESHITLRIKVQTGEKYNFHFRGNNVIARSELLSNIKFYIRNNLGKFNEDELNKVIVAIYEKRGIYNTDVKIGKRFGINKYNISFNNLYFKIIEGTKIPIEEIRFTGNEKLDNRILEKIYNDNATPIASGGYLDQDYLDEYPALLKKAYLERGYVFINSSKPKIIFSEKFNKAIVEYRIRERQRTKLGKIIIKNIEDEIISQIKKVMKNKENSYLNLVAIQDDLNTIIQIIQNQGYYFAEILNQDRGELLSYDTGYLNATLNVDVRTGKKIIFNEVIVTGNEKTKTEVITRLLRIKKDEKITRKNVQQMKKDISYLGLFSTIKITPYIRKQREGTDEYYANLLIQVKERNFGVVEVAPGFRTDIGMKISGAVAYNNLMGMNRSAMFKVQANSRLDYNNFDERRRMERKRVIEYSVKTGFTEPHTPIFPMEFDLELSHSRRRFFSFDADISKVSTTFSKNLLKWLTLSVKYQLEVIAPFDASEEKDRDYFRIGSFIPSISIDHRDNKINPRKGTFFGLSYEIANPNFYSMNKPDLEINFIRLISRNKFYASYKNMVFALSISGGYEKNMVKEKYIYQDDGRVTRGFIPSIKVFRLNGVDVVRGFEDAEINRVDMENVPDISEVIVDNTAFFANIKFEPRYLVDDNIMMGVFLDAGRVFVNHFKPVKLRTATGISLKFLTPVGTLDFDYGVKIQRKTHVGGKRESFGRFHLSIGYF